MPRNEPKSSAEIKLEKIDRGIELMDVRVTTIDQRLDRIAQMLEANTQQIQANTQQVATFSEGLVRLENIITKGFERLEREADRRDRQIDKLIELAAEQHAHISSLTQKLPQL